MQKVIEHQEMMLRNNLKLIAALQKEIESHYQDDERFSDKEIAKLLELKWWNWPIEQITANVHHLTGENLEELN